MAKVMVTGGAGFIGSALVRRLIEDDHEVVVLDALTYAGCKDNLAGLPHGAACTFIEGSIADRTLVRRIFDQHMPQWVINAAAETHVDRSIDSPEAFFTTNLTGTVVLLETCREYLPALEQSARARFRFVQVSTDEVYGSIASGTVDELAPLRPVSPYAASKAAGDLAALAFHRTYGVPVIVTRGSNTYGPRQFPEKLIPLMILSAVHGRELPVYGDGRYVREWLHVDDHVTGIVSAAVRGRPGEIYNLASGASIANIELVEALCAEIDLKRPPRDNLPTASRIAFVPDRPAHDLRYALDCRKAHQDLVWRAAMPLKEGLVATIEWYLGNEPWWTPIVAKRYDLSRLGLTTCPAG